MKISLFGLDNMSKNAMYNVVILIRVHFSVFSSMEYYRTETNLKLPLTTFCSFIACKANRFHVAVG